MAQNQQKRQQKLAKKKKRTNEIQKERNKRLNTSSREVVIKAAERAPWSGCYRTGNEGLYSVFAIRQTRSGMVASVFLVDAYCLGVKDSFVIRSFDMEALREANPDAELKQVSPEHALKFIDEAVVYARSIGFEPNGDFAVARLLFGQTDSSACNDTFEFGKDGKPLYINSQNDSEFKQRLILETLSKLGQGNYHFVKFTGQPGSPDAFRAITNLETERSNEFEEGEDDDFIAEGEFDEYDDDSDEMVIDAVDVRPAR
jgi:hypothetical protein